MNPYQKKSRGRGTPFRVHNRSRLSSLYALCFPSRGGWLGLGRRYPRGDTQGQKNTRRPLTLRLEGRVIWVAFTKMFRIPAISSSHCATEYSVTKFEEVWKWTLDSGELRRPVQRLPLLLLVRYVKQTFMQTHDLNSKESLLS
ncbi:hypothetical protein KM043_014809 [Ampulex compressa]|nr:hypothetical protein KM043_014809 [Ampulex compressa]